MRRSLVEVDEVVLAVFPGGLADDFGKHVAPVNLSGQVGAAGHEGVAKLWGEGSEVRGEGKCEAEKAGKVQAR